MTIVNSLTTIFSTYFNDSHRAIETANQCLALVPNKDSAVAFCNAVNVETVKAGILAAKEVASEAAQTAASSCGIETLQAVKSLAWQKAQENPLIATGVAVATGALFAYGIARSCGRGCSTQQETEATRLSSNIKPK